MPRAEIASKQAVYTLGLLHAELAGKLLAKQAGSHPATDGNDAGTEAGVTMKLKRGTFSATFFLGCLAALELEGLVLEEI
jgi:hypothetical protein